jgi:dolichol-phosphate mannosyltransferase
MKIHNKVIIAPVFYNEKGKIENLLKKIETVKIDLQQLILLVDDASTDGSSEVVKKFIAKKRRNRYKLITKKTNRGVGDSIRMAIDYGLDNDFDICVIMAGNGKDNPKEISKLLNPIIKDDYDYVQGSRYLKGGSSKNLPFYRHVLIKIFTFMFYLLTGFKASDTSNGFRAYKLSIFKNKKINLDQSWLDRYELETYIHYKVLTLGYKVKEVPVTKNYIRTVKSYTKMRPVIDWWKMSRPLFLLKLGLRN